MDSRRTLRFVSKVSIIKLTHLTGGKKLMKESVRTYNLPVPAELATKAKIAATRKEMFYKDFLIEAIKEKVDRETKKK